MQLLRLCALLAFAVSAPAFAQWQWVDKDGRKVFSDQAPPADVPASRVLKRPGRFAAAEAAAAAQAASDAAVALPAAPPKAAGRDKDLEEKKKQMQAAADEKRHAQEEADARIKADNCQRARRGKAALDSGVRIAQTNDKGEREFMDDAQREAEGRRLDGMIAHECQ